MFNYFASFEKCLASKGIPHLNSGFNIPDKKELGHLALEAAQQILKFYNGYYAIKYPFGKLDVVAVPDFAAKRLMWYQHFEIDVSSRATSISGSFRSAAPCSSRRTPSRSRRR